MAALLEESVSVSRDVVRVLAGAAKVRESTDHLLRTWQARHDLPSDADVLDPNMFPRPPPGTRREVLPAPTTVPVNAASAPHLHHGLVPAASLGPASECFLQLVVIDL